MPTQAVNYEKAPQRFGYTIDIKAVFQETVLENFMGETEVKLL